MSQLPPRAEILKHVQENILHANQTIKRSSGIIGFHVIVLPPRDMRDKHIAAYVYDPFQENIMYSMHPDVKNRAMQLDEFCHHLHNLSAVFKASFMNIPIDGREIWYYDFAKNIFRSQENKVFKDLFIGACALNSAQQLHAV